jgi:hypothetical protein
MNGASLELLSRGCVAPLTFIESARSDRLGRFDGSVHYSSGEICELGKVGLLRHNYEPAPLDVNLLLHSDGHHVFGGLLHNGHFGHFIAESLARLWAFDHLDAKYSSVVFYLRQTHLPVAGFVSETLEILIPNIETQIVRVPTEFEVLAVPQELKKGSYIVGHPLVKAMCKRLRSRDTGGAKKVYVSRSRLSLGQGGIFYDHLVDEYMQAEGYRVLYPETMSVREQLDAYAAAERLVFADGSALHLYALVANPDQYVFVIWRRGKYGIFNWQVNSFGGPPVQGEPCLEQLWVPEDKAPDAAHGKAVLNFSLLSKQLREAGFITHAPWDELKPSEIEKQLAMVTSKEGRKFVLIPIPR